MKAQRRNSDGSRSRRPKWIGAGMAAVLAAVVALAALSSSVDESSQTKPLALEPAPAASVPVGETAFTAAKEVADPSMSGARAYRDPVTGEFTSGPTTPTGRVTQPVFAPRNRSHAGLYEEATPNGVMVDFQGRFFTASIATRDKDGNITVRPGAPQNSPVDSDTADTTELDS